MHCGVDLLEIRRMSRSLQNPRFVRRVFGPRERRELEAKGFPVASAAAAFCAKEAFAKALETGIRGFALTEVELLHNRQGAPFLALSGRARTLAEQRGLRFAVSASHTKEYAVAQVVAWSNA